MKKSFLLVLALVMGTSSLVHAQIDMKKAVEEKQNEFLETMKQEIKSTVVKTKDSKLDWGKAGGTGKKDIEGRRQFFIANLPSTWSPTSADATKRKELLGDDVLNVKSVYGQLLIFHSKVSEIEFDKPVVSGSGKEFAAVFNSHIVTQLPLKGATDVQDQVNEANYKVTMKWQVKTKGSGNKEEIKSIELISVSATPANNDAEIIAKKKAEAKRVINEWYADADKGRAAVENELKNSDLKEDITMPSVDNIQVSLNNAKSKSVNVEGKPIRVKIAPDFKGKEYLYDVETAFATQILTPTFTVNFDNEGKAKDDVKVAFKSEIKDPETNSDRQERYNNLVDTYNYYANKISSFAQNKNDKELRNELEAMFDSKNSPIETSVKKGSRVNVRKAGKGAKTAANYFKTLKAEDINIDARFVEGDVLDNTAVLEIPFTQHYQGKKYCDETKKVMHLKWNEEQKKYLIEKIVVVEDGTTLCDE